MHKGYSFFSLSILLTGLLLILFKKEQPAPNPQSHPGTKFIDSLINLMTLEEKIGQMTLYTTDWGSTGPTIREGYEADIRSGACGALFNSHTTAFTRRLQEIAVNESRLGIPLIFGYDVIHGYKTIFPIPLAESCSWDLHAMESSAAVAAAEAAAAGLHWTFAPMVDISRDPRWGRVMEGAGEDPFLGSQIAVARVKGFQGNGFENGDRVVSCIKHYAAYGAPIAGREYNTVELTERTFRDFYLPPYQAGIEAGALTVMTSFNDFDGIPASANKFLLQNILRDEMKFKGFVVTDYTSINEMVNHGYAEDDRHAGELALNAGVDMDMQGGIFQRFLKNDVESGKVSIDRINEAVRYILEVKYDLGLFNDPFKYCNAERERNVVFSEANKEIARDVARKSIVLLKNNTETLPLHKNQKIALVGPLAADGAQLLGAWSGAGEGDKCISLLQAFDERKMKDKISFTHHKGCEISEPDMSGFNEAIEAAKAADIIVAVVGEHRDMSGEAAARADITIPGVQEELLRKLKETGKPLVVVLMNGRPLAIPWVAENADAILETWFLGTMGGPAIADVLFGDYNPSGKLTMSFPRHVGQVPVYYNEKNTGRPMDPNSKWTSKYLDLPNSPLYPFGYGLSYSSFSYSDFKLSGSTLSANSSLTASVNVKNTGKVTGDETVQWYVRDMVGSITRPTKELKGYQKIKLQPGESKTVTFSITPDKLTFIGPDMKRIYESGKFQLMVGPNSEEVSMLEFSLQ